jgi:hypothetical protein
MLKKGSQVAAMQATRDCTGLHAQIYSTAGGVKASSLAPNVYLGGTCMYMYRSGEVEEPSDGLPSPSAYVAAIALPGTREQVQLRFTRT